MRSATIVLIINVIAQSGLNLVACAIVLWIQSTWNVQCCKLCGIGGKEVDDKLLSHLSPLCWEHIDLTGDYVGNRAGKLHRASSDRWSGLSVRFFPFSEATP